MGCECSKTRKPDKEEKPKSEENQIESQKTAESLEELGRKSTIRLLQTPLTTLYRYISPKQAQYSSKGATAEYMHIRKLCVIRAFSKAKAANIDQVRSEFGAKIEILCKLDHPNIVQIYEVLEDARNFYIVSEDLQGGQLWDYTRSIGILQESVVASIMSQVLEAICYSHSQGVVHRNLKFSNLYLKTVPRDSTLHVKVTGFDNTGPFASSKVSIGAPSCYIAPEMYSSKVDERSDIWSCGAILAALLTEEEQLISPMEYTEHLQGNEPLPLCFDSKAWTRVSADARSLVQSMLEWDPARRPTAWECLQAPWFAVYHSAGTLRSREVRRALGNIVASSKTSELKYAIMQFILYRIIDSQTIASLTSSFKAIDTNCDGQISREELVHALRRIMKESQAENAADDIIMKVERNWNGAIDYSEFLISAIGEKHLLSPENLAVVFNCLDRDLNGRITMQELKSIFFLNTLKRKEELWQELMRKADKSGDGEIDKEEFFQVMTKALD